MRLVIVAMVLVVSGCSDSLERVSNEVYSGGVQFSGPSKFDASTAPAERAYYIQKYGANAEQQRKAMDAGRRLIAARTRGEVKNASRYAAIEVPKSQLSKGKTQTMIFDTKTESIVGNEVYDLPKRPRTDATLVFDTITANYVGS